MEPRVFYPAGHGDWKPGERVIAHIDMDAFYASVEILDFPELKDKPIVVGGSSNRGVVSAAGYKARQFGIHSAMPIFQAKRLCPGLIIRPGRMRRYAELSEAVMKTLHGFSPLIEQISIDEAYIDLTGTEKLFGRPELAVAAVKGKILENTSLTSSAGLSTSKLVAKVASDMNKPDGITIIPPGRVGGFLRGLPVGKVPGVGGKTEESLAKIGVKKLGDALRFSPGYLEERFGKFGAYLLDVARGEISSRITTYTQPKSVSNEITLDEDTDSVEALETRLMELSEKVGRRLRRDGLNGSTVTLKLKDSKHRLITRSVTLPHPTHLGKTIYSEARKLLLEHGIDTKMRLIGVGVSNFEAEEADDQLPLFSEKDPVDEKWDRVERAVDDIIERFGRGAVKRGRLHEER